jgi:hypothetical protein
MAIVINDWEIWVQNKNLARPKLIHEFGKDLLIVITIMGTILVMLFAFNNEGLR